MPTMVTVAVVFGFVLANVAFLFVSEATAGVAIIGYACFLAIVARVLQAAAYRQVDEDRYRRVQTRDELEAANRSRAREQPHPLRR